MPKILSRKINLLVEKVGKCRARICKSLQKLTNIDMANQTKIKANIRLEVRGDILQERIRARAQTIAQGIENDIADEVGELVGKLTTDYADNGSEAESKMASYAFNQIYDALRREIKKQL